MVELIYIKLLAFAMCWRWRQKHPTRIAINNAHCAPFDNRAPVLDCGIFGANSFLYRWQQNYSIYIKRKSLRLTAAI